MTDKILLEYTTEKAEEPVISSIIRKTDTAINILHADLTPKGGEIFVSIDSSKEKFEEIVNLFEDSGVQVTEVKEGMKLDEEKCIECGACISICPTEALNLSDEDYSIELDEEKCIYCRACIPVCPVDALSIESF